MKDSEENRRAVKEFTSIQTKEQLHEMFLQAPAGTAIYTGRDMIISFVNDKMISLWGKDKSVLGKKLTDALPEIQDRSFLKLLDEVYMTGITYHANEDKAMLWVDNELQAFRFNFTYKPLTDDNNKVYAILHMATDINYHLEAKQKLALAEEKLRYAIEAANLGTWEYNPLTNEVILNERLKEWRGLVTKENVTAQDILEGAPGNEFLLDELNKAIQSGESSINVEYDVINANNGERKRLHSRGKVFFDTDNKPILMSGITRDVTLQRLNDADMANNVAAKTAELAGVNNDLRRLNENLEQFVYVASHDLQEPLRKINIFSDMLQKSSADLNEEGKMYIGKIEKSAKRMSFLINDLLEFSRISSNENIFVPTDLNRIISDIKIDYELLIKQKNATLEIEPLPVIEAIPLQMNQLFYNLIGNSLKFAKKDVPSAISVSCEMLSEKEIIKYKLSPKGAFCNIIVKDNGIGFNPKYAEKIFEIFQRLHGKHEYAGTGIGLSLAKKIADNHGGCITASSAEGTGASFNVILPVRREDIETHWK